MSRLTISRPTPALVLAFVALLCSLAGTTYAAATISGKSIQKRSVPANRVVNDALSGKQVNESLLGEVPSAASAKTALTADKATTADTATTADKATQADKATDADQLGGRAPSAYLRSKPAARISLQINIAVNAGVERTASCQAGEVAVGGGGAWYISGTDTTIGSGTLSTSAPLLNGEGTPVAWRAEGKNTSAVARDFRAWVVCAPAG